MSAPNSGEKGRRRRVVLVLAAVAGFIGPGELAAAPGTMFRMLLALFVMVFLVMLALSVLADSIGRVLHRSSAAMPRNHEAIYESP